MKRHFWNIYTIYLISFSLILFWACSSSVKNEAEAQEIIQKSYNDTVPESINNRYLENAGRSIVPYLLKEIQNKEMPKRGYAILALGKIGDQRALDVLQETLNDNSEA